MTLIDYSPTVFSLGRTYWLSNNPLTMRRTLNIKLLKNEFELTVRRFSGRTSELTLTNYVVTEINYLDDLVVTNHFPHVILTPLDIDLFFKRLDYGGSF